MNSLVFSRRRTLSRSLRKEQDLISLFLQHNSKFIQVSDVTWPSTDWRFYCNFHIGPYRLTWNMSDLLDSARRWSLGLDLGIRYPQTLAPSHSIPQVALSPYALCECSLATVSIVLEMYTNEKLWTSMFAFVKQTLPLLHIRSRPITSEII